MVGPTSIVATSQTHHLVGHKLSVDGTDTRVDETDTRVGGTDTQLFRQPIRGPDACMCTKPELVGRRPPFYSALVERALVGT